MCRAFSVLTRGVMCDEFNIYIYIYIYECVCVDYAAR